MIISMLFCVLCALLFYQRGSSRIYCAAIFLSFTIIHQLLLSGIDGWSYYASSALFDLAVIGLLSNVSPITKLAINLQRISLLSMLTNAIGYALWFFYLDPALYNTMFIGIYSIAIFALMNRDGAYDVGFYSWYSSLRSVGAASRRIHAKYSGEARP